MVPFYPPKRLNQCLLQHVQNVNKKEHPQTVLYQYKVFNTRYRQTPLRPGYSNVSTMNNLHLILTFPVIFSKLEYVFR